VFNKVIGDYGNCFLCNILTSDYTALYLTIIVVNNITYVLAERKTDGREGKYDTVMNSLLGPDEDIENKIFTAMNDKLHQLEDQ
jgi:hypothetical protein